MAVEYLTEDEVLLLNRRFIGPPALRDLGGFSSAVHRPMPSAFGEDAYPTIFLKAAALMQSLAENQSFVDGNKRIAWFADEGNALFRSRIANGMTIRELASWLESHSQTT